MNSSQALPRLIDNNQNNITNRFKNRIHDDNLSLLIEIRNDLIEINNVMINGSSPKWLLDSVFSFNEHFLKLVETSYASANDDAVSKFWKTLYLNPSSNSDFYYPSIPTIRTYLHSEKFKMIEITDVIHQLIEGKISEKTNSINAILNNLTNIKTESETALSLMNAEIGKIAVKQYASIFDNQASDHSKKFDPESSETDSLGRAQRWLVAGIFTAALFVVFVYNLDKFISIDGETWTPKNITHVAGRISILSIFGFFISFCFKQYRINKHLFTLNKHRANTLNSFEFLVQAIDNKDASTKNAILMKVAETIYSAGNTGYINTNDSSSDSASIIDMTKVITSNGKD